MENSMTEKIDIDSLSILDAKNLEKLNLLVDGKALEALKVFAEETAHEDVRADLVAKAKA